jgi:hypothetical protein
MGLNQGVDVVHCRWTQKVQKGPCKIEEAAAGQSYTRTLTHTLAPGSD